MGLSYRHAVANVTPLGKFLISCLRFSSEILSAVLHAS